MQGVIKKLTDRHFGFISQEDGGEDLFFHSNALEGIGFDELKEGDAVTFKVVKTDRGLAATEIKKA